MMLTPAVEFFGHTSPPMDASWRPSSSESEKTSIVDYVEEIAEANGDYKLEKEKDEVVPERSSSCRFYLRKEGKHYDA